MKNHSSHHSLPIRIVLVEDEAALLDNLVKLIESLDGCQCIGTFSNSAEAVRNMASLQPDVVLMDIMMPEPDGIECVRALKPLLPDTEFVILTVYEDTESIFRALRAGASGYLLKRAGREELHQAILQVHNGGAPMDSHIARKVVQTFRSQENNHDSTLSTREDEVLQLLAEGMLYKEIAETLSVSYATVNNHVRHIYKKLHVNSRNQAIEIFKRRDIPQSANKRRN